MVKYCPYMSRPSRWVQLVTGVGGVGGVGASVCDSDPQIRYLCACVVAASSCHRMSTARYYTGAAIYLPIRRARAQRNSPGSRAGKSRKPGDDVSCRDCESVDGIVGRTPLTTDGEEVTAVFQRQRAARHVQKTRPQHRDIAALLRRPQAGTA